MLEEFLLQVISEGKNIVRPVGGNALSVKNRQCSSLSINRKGVRNLRFMLCMRTPVCWERAADPTLPLCIEHIPCRTLGIALSNNACRYCVKPEGKYKIQPVGDNALSVKVYEFR